MTIQARIRNGQIELDEAIPADWEGCPVKITTMTPDDPIPDLEDRLAVLHALGPMELDAAERAAGAAALSELNTLSKAEMQAIGRGEH